MPKNCPVDQIFGVKDWQTGGATETGCDQVEVVAVANHVRIRIVRKDDGVSVSSVALIRDPGEMCVMPFVGLSIQCAPV